MQATATEDEIASSRCAWTTSLITKDSESGIDIGVPALVLETASDLVCGYHLALLRPHKQQIGRRVPVPVPTGEARPRSSWNWRRTA